MKSSFQKIQELTLELQGLQPIPKERQAVLDKKFRLEFNYNSNHIEGNTLTYGETELLLIFDQTQGNHTLREFEEMKAHDVVFNLIEEWAKDGERPLSEQIIKSLNEIILVRPFWKEAITPDGQKTRRLIKVGDYKEFPNSVLLRNGEIFEYASVTDTPILMGELVEWYKTEEGKMNPVALAAHLHYKFVRIHPFDDGNGRTARLLMNYVLLKHGLPPVIIKSAAADKNNYLMALNRADAGDTEAFVQHIAEQLIWSLEISIKAAKGENIEEEGDLDKKIALLDRELRTVDPNDQIQVRFNIEVFKNIFYSWLGELIKKVIPEIQRFNRYFIGTKHLIHLVSNVSTEFTDESPYRIFEKLNSLLASEISLHEYQSSTTEIIAHYGAFAKGGTNTFGCEYHIVIKFDTIQYQVSVDEFEAPCDHSKEVILFKKLLHQPLTETEIREAVNKLTDSIYQHIDYQTKKIGLR